MRTQVWSPTAVGRAVVAVSVVAGIAATVDGPSPTGSAPVDTVLVAATVAVVTWLGAAASRGQAAVTTMIAGLASWSIAGAATGFLAGILGYADPDRRGIETVINAGMVGLSLNLLCRSRLDSFFGASSIVGVCIAVVIAALGLRRRSRSTRRALRIGALAVSSLAVIGLAGLAYGAWSALDDIRAANRVPEQALAQLSDGDLDGAQASFAEAAEAFEHADEALSNPVGQLARLVPVVAQHRRAAVELSSTAARASATIAEQLELVDLDSLTVVDGRIDVAQVRALQAPLLAIQTEIEALETSITETRSPWLAAPIAERIDDLAADMSAQRERSDDALAVASAAPALLGGDEPRVYFIAFTTPSEVRGLGGFMGNWAEMTVDEGEITLTRFGRTDDLETAAAPGTRFITGPEDWLARYGPYQMTTGKSGSTGGQPWHNVTMSPDMESTAQVIAELYPQSGGQELDGVFALDVYTLARFLEFTGPIELPEGSGPADGGWITAENAAQFLLNDQYDQTELDVRVDVLETVSFRVADALLTGALPPPKDLVDVLGPMVEQGRLTAYAVRPDEQALLRRIGLGTTLPELEPASPDDEPPIDALAIAFNNAAGSKIDYYLSSSATYRVAADAGTGTASGRLELVMTNNAPLTDEPRYVIGNLIGMPPGENRTYVSVFSRLPVQEMFIDDKRLDPELGTESGYSVASVFVQIPAGETVTVSFVLGGPLALDDGYTLAARTPAGVIPTPIDVDVTYRHGDGVSERITGSRDDPGTMHLAITG